MRKRSTALWMAGAFCAAMAPAAAVLAPCLARGSGARAWPCRPRRGYRLCRSGLPTALPHWPHRLALMGSLPFVLLAVAGPVLRLAAFGHRVLTFAGKLRHSGHSSH